MMSFLSKNVQQGQTKGQASQKMLREDPDPEVEEDFADDSDFFEEDALNMSYSPSEN